MICCGAVMAVIDSVKQQADDNKAIEYQNIVVPAESAALVSVQTWHNYGLDVLQRFEGVEGLEKVIATIYNITRHSAVSHFLKKVYSIAAAEKKPINFNSFDTILKRSASISRWSKDLINLLNSYEPAKSETTNYDDIYFEGIKYEESAIALSKLIYEDIDETIYRLMVVDKFKQMVLFAYVSYMSALAENIKALAASPPPKAPKMAYVVKILPMMEVLVTIGNIFEKAYTPEAIDQYQDKHGYFYMLHQFDMAYNFGTVAYGFDLLLKCLLSPDGISNVAELNNSPVLEQSFKDWSQLVNGHAHVLTQLETEFIDLIHSGGDKDQKKRLQWKDKLTSYNVIQIVFSKALVLILDNFPSPKNFDLAAKLEILKKDLKTPAHAENNDDKAKWVHEHRGSFYQFYAGW